MKPTASLIKFAPIVATLALTTSIYAVDGTWTATATSGNWTDALNWSGSTIADGATSTALFTSDITALTTVTLTAPRTIGNITFSDNGSAGSAWTIAGAGANILTLGDNGATALTPTITTTTNATISSIITGNDGLRKEGAGTLTLSGVNTYTGGTFVNSGTLVQDMSTRPGTTTLIGAVTVASGAVYELLSGTNTTADSTLFQNNTFSGAGTIRKTGTGYIGIAHTGSNTNGFSGTYDIQAGILGFNNGVQGSGLATVNLSGATAKLDVRTGTVQIDALTGVAGSQVYTSFNSGNTLSLGNNNGSGTFNGAIVGGTANLILIKNGTGTQTLTGTNTYTGATIVNGGILDLASSTATAAISASSALTLGGGTLRLNSGTATSQTFNGLTTTANTGSAVVAGSGKTISLGALSVGAGSAVNFNISTGGTIQTSTPSITSKNFTVTDATGFGLATVSGSNIIRLAGTTLPGSGATSPNDYSTSGNLTVTTSQSAGSITADTTGSNGLLTLNSGVTLNNNTWNFGGVGTNTYGITGGTGLTSVASGGTINFNNYNTGAVTIGSAIVANGANAVNFAGTGTTVLTGVNTYTGATTISGGTLEIAGAGSLNSGNYAGAVAINTGATLKYNSSANQTLSGAISGVGSLIKAGAGTLTLSNTTASTYTGLTTINAGTLLLGATSGIRAIAGDIVVNSGGTLAFNTNYNQLGQPGTAGAPVNTVTVNSGGNLTWANTVQTFNNLTLNGTNLVLNGGHASAWGALVVLNTLTATGNSSITAASGGNNWMSPGDVAGATTLKVSVTGVSDNLTIALPIQDYASNKTYALTKTGAGTLILNGTNTYTGATTVNGGTLVINGNNTGNSAITVNGGTLRFGAFGSINNSAVTLTNAAGATLDLNGSGASVGSLAGGGATGGNVTLGAGTLTTGVNNTNTSFAGTISGAGNLVKVGTGTQTLSGASTYTGKTSVAAGTLLLDFSAAGTLTTNILASSSTLSLAGGTLGIKGAASAANSQTFNGVSGFGTLSLTPNGATSLNASLGALSGTASIDFVGANTTVVGGGGAATAGTANFITTTTTAANNGTTRLGWSLWNGTDWASTASDGANTYVVAWQGAYNGLTSNGAASNSAGDLKIATGGGAVGTATTYNANTSINSLLMTATDFATTVGINAGITLTLNTDANGNGGVVIGSTGKSLTIGSAVGQGNLTAGTTAGSTLVLNNLNSASALTVNSVITDNAAGTGSVSLSTAGAVTLAAANTFKGSVTINGGTLQLSNVNALTLNNDVTLAAGSTNATLAFGNGIGTAQIKSLTVGAGATGATIQSQTWAPQVNGITTLNSALTEKGMSGGGWNGVVFKSKITGAGAGAGNDSLILDANGQTATSNGFVWQYDGTVANDFVGNVRVKGGTTNAQALGSNSHLNVLIPDAAMLTIDSGSTLRWNNTNGGHVIETIDGLAGGGVFDKAGAGASSALTINANNTANNGKRVFTGSLNNWSSLTLNGTGTQEFSGANLNYANATNLNNGTLKLTDTTSWNSDITLGGSNTPKLQLNRTTGTWILSKAISGGSINAVVEKLGSGTVILTNSNTYTGTTTIKSGTLALSGSGALASSKIIVGDTGSSGTILDVANITSGTFTVGTSQTVSGIGTMNAGGKTVSVAGSIAPGNSAGLLSVSTTSLQFASTGALNMELTRGLTPAAGTSYDQLGINGALDIAPGADLNLTAVGTGTYALDSIYFLIANDGTDAITGQFDGFTEGGQITFDSQLFKVTYDANYTGTGPDGGTFTGGNDFALMAVPEPNVAALLGSLGMLALLRRRRA